MTVRVGGPPAGSRPVERPVAVLRGTSAAAWTPRFSGGRIELAKTPDADGLVRKVRPHKLSINRAVRLAQALHLEALSDDRTVHVFELDGAFHAHVYDGRGRLVEDLAPGPTDEPTARVLARAECYRLRELADAQPWRWEIVPWKRRRPAGTDRPDPTPVCDPAADSQLELAGAAPAS